VAGSPTAEGAPARGEAKPPRSYQSLAVNLLIWVGSLFVLGASVIHFRLWDSFGYRAVPTIGPLFLMQAIVGVVLAVLTSVAAVTWTSVGRRVLLVLVEAGFAFSTAFGLILSINVGLFGFKDSLSAPYAGLALAVEFTAGTLLLAASALLGLEWLEQRRRRASSGGAGAPTSGHVARRRRHAGTAGV
jgi:hypothetical protein